MCRLFFFFFVSSRPRDSRNYVNAFSKTVRETRIHVRFRRPLLYEILRFPWRLRNRSLTDLCFCFFFSFFTIIMRRRSDRRCSAFYVKTTNECQLCEIHDSQRALVDTGPTVFPILFPIPSRTSGDGAARPESIRRLTGGRFRFL